MSQSFKNIKQAWPAGLSKGHCEEEWGKSQPQKVGVIGNWIKPIECNLVEASASFNTRRKNCLCSLSPPLSDICWSNNSHISKSHWLIVSYLSSFPGVEVEGMRKGHGKECPTAWRWSRILTQSQSDWIHRNGVTHQHAGDRQAAKRERRVCRLSRTPVFSTAQHFLLNNPGLLRGTHGIFINWSTPTLPHSPKPSNISFMYQLVLQLCRTCLLELHCGKLGHSCVYYRLLPDLLLSTTTTHCGRHFSPTEGFTLQHLVLGVHLNQGVLQSSSHLPGS